MLGKFLLELLGKLLGLLDYCFLLVNLVPGNSCTKFFGGGYGDLSVYYKRLRSSLNGLATGTYRFRLQDKDIEWDGENMLSGNVSVQIGRFRSPVAHLLPEEAADCRFHLVLPKATETYGNNRNAVYIVMLPATGEMGTSTRMAMAKQLAERRGWASILITAPFYSVRKPKRQTLFFLNTVTDILLQSQAIIEESAALAMYCLSKGDKTKVCLTGFSYGAAMSACSAAFVQQQLFQRKDNKEEARIACAAYVGSASPVVLADGIMESSIDWEALGASESSGKSGIDALDGLTPRQKLYEELNKTQLGMLLVNNNNPEYKNSVPPVYSRAYSMSHDLFIRKSYAKDFLSQLKAMSNDFSMEWIPGGHVAGAIGRSFLHTRLVEETAESLIS